MEIIVRINWVSDQNIVWKAAWNVQVGQMD